MKKYAVVLMIALLTLPKVVLAREAVDEIDLEVIRLLGMNSEQSVAYSLVMQQQRVEFRIRKPLDWVQQQAFYEETFARVKPVLNEEQYIRFIAYMDSFLEAIPKPNLLAME